MPLQKAARWFQLRRLLCLLVICWLATFLYLYLSSGPELESSLKDPSAREPESGELMRLRLELSSAKQKLITLQRENDQLSHTLDKINRRGLENGPLKPQPPSSALDTEPQPPAHVPSAKLPESSTLEVSAAGTRAPSLAHERLLRRARRTLQELGFFVQAQLLKPDSDSTRQVKQVQRAANIVLDQQRMASRALAELADADGARDWRAAYNRQLGNLIQKRLFYLQNPSDCQGAKKLVCNVNKGCGFGCELHHVTYCFQVAYAQRRVLILNSASWRYADRGGWDTVFLPLSRTCLDASDSPTQFGTASENEQVVALPIIDSLGWRPEFLPLAVPGDLLERLELLNTNPFTFWAGHLVRYLLRMQPHTALALNKSMNAMRYQKPIVGIHIRRTDKVGTEAAFHSVDEYMAHAVAFFDELDARLKRKHTRRVFIASDEASVIPEARNKYPDFTVLGDERRAESGGVNARYSRSSLMNLLVDLEALSQSDFLVCTFSSQVCRVAYEIMQTLPENGDPSSWFRSLDDIYYFGGQNGHSYRAIADQKPSDEVGAETEPLFEMHAGDVVGIAGNHWNGYSKGSSRTRSGHGLFYSYRAEDLLVGARMANYDDVDAQPDPPHALHL